MIRFLEIRSLSRKKRSSKHIIATSRRQRMKIVIDIDNEAYGRIQALVNADYFEHDICGYAMQRIANGTPYEERPDCITSFCGDI
jgi:hypothetical protein